MVSDSIGDPSMDVHTIIVHTIITTIVRHVLIVMVCGGVTRDDFLD